MKKTILTAAVLGSLYASAAFAAVQTGNINDKTANPYVLAKELTSSSTGTKDRLTGSADLFSDIGFNVGAGTTVYARISCGASTTEFDFPTGTTVTLPSGYTAGAVNGFGTNTITVSITRDNAATTGVSTDMITVDGGTTGFGLLKTQDNFNCEYKLYENLTDAVNNASNSLASNSNEAFVTRKNAYTFATANQATLTADVAATDGPYNSFTGATDGPLRLTDYTISIPSGTIKLDGNPVLMTDLATAQKYSVTTTQKIDLTSLTIFASGSSTCGTQDAVFTAAGTDNTTKEFTQTPASTGSGYLCVTNAGGTTTPISAADFTLTLIPTPAANATTSTKGPLDAGKIVRNGTVLEATLVNNPANYISRVAVSNSGTVDRPFTVRILGDGGFAGGNTSAGAVVGGTAKAGKITTVDVSSLITFTPDTATRAAVILTVNGPNNEIQGMYQIVRPDSGAISNAQMVRPGSN